MADPICVPFSNRRNVSPSRTTAMWVQSEKFGFAIPVRDINSTPEEVTVKSQVVELLVMFIKLLLSCSCEKTAAVSSDPTGDVNMTQKSNVKSPSAKYTSSVSSARMESSFPNSSD